MVGCSAVLTCLGVRRCDAPPLRLYARGAFERARAMLASPSQRKAGVEKLRSEVHAATSRRTRISRIKTLRRLSAEAWSPSLAGYERWHGVAGGGPQVWDVQEPSDLLGDLEAVAHKGRASVDRRSGRNKDRVQSQFGERYRAGQACSRGET